MRTDFRDWVAAASGRVYSVATVEAAHALDARRRREVRRGVYRGALPADRDGLRYGTALARDLDRMRPRPEPRKAIWGAASAYALMVLINILGGTPSLAVIFAAIGTYVVGVAVVEQRRRVHLRPVILAGYARLTPDDRAFFDHAVRKPLHLSWKALAIGHLAWLPACAVLVAAGWGIATAGFEDAGSDAPFLAIFFPVLVVAILLFSTHRNRRRFTREILGEPRPVSVPGRGSAEPVSS